MPSKRAADEFARIFARSLLLRYREQHPEDVHLDDHVVLTRVDEWKGTFDGARAMLLAQSDARAQCQHLR